MTWSRCLNEILVITALTFQNTLIYFGRGVGSLQAMGCVPLCESLQKLLMCTTWTQSPSAKMQEEKAGLLVSITLLAAFVLFFVFSLQDLLSK